MILRRTRLATAALAAPLALALAACGSDDTDDTSSDDTGSSVSSTPSPTTDDDPATSAAPASPETTGSTSTAPASDDATFLDAAALGAGVGTVFSVDLERTGYEISVVDRSGAESDLVVDAEASGITSGPTPERDDDADDLAERQRLLQVPLTYVDAVDAARQEDSSGTLTGVELGEDDGALTWEVQLDEDTVDERTVVLDAETGAVLRVERDD